MKALFIGGTGTISTARFDQGVRMAIEYVLSHPECQKEDTEFDAWCDSVIEAQEKALDAVRTVYRKEV